MIEAPVKKRAIIFIMAEKFHVEPAAITSSRPGGLSVLTGALAEWLGKLPAGMLRYLGSLSRGHIVLKASPSSYYREDYLFRGKPFSGVALLSLADLEEGLKPPALHALGHLLDDLLGRGESTEGAWLSEGGGALPPLREVGQRIVDLFILGYGVDEAARESPREYFAQSLALYFADEGRLNIADPPMHRLLKRALLAEGFWHQITSEETGEI